MATVGSYEAKTHLASLLDKVERGESITITRHGIPVAKLVPPSVETRRPAREVIADIRALRDSMNLTGLPVCELIDEGRP